MSDSISGEVSRVTYQNEESGFRVIRVQVPKRGPITCVGKFPFVAEGAHVSLDGEFVMDGKHGQQFRVHSLVVVEPNTLAGLEKYLGSGLVPGVGPGYAKRIVETFGLETLRVLDENPGRLAEVQGLGQKRIEEIRLRWREQRALGNLTLILQSHGVPGHLARRILERYADRAAEMVQTHPYRLALDVRGVGFKTADQLAQSSGISKTHPERAEAGVYHQLRHFADQGHVFIPRDVLLSAAVEFLEIDPEYIAAAIDKLWAANRLVVDQEAVYLSELHRAEVGLVEQTARLAEFRAPRLHGVDDAIASFEKLAGIELAPQQRHAVEAVAAHKIVVITGGPGVGKTTLVKAILSVFERAKLTTLLAAPTGRAAKRLTESTGRQATTIHRLLEYDPKLRGFRRGPEDPLAAQAVIVDEASMIDLALAESLWSALPDPARLVIVGDSDQLPSVGPGAVLRDLISSGVATVVRLNEIFRQVGHSTIVSNAHRILSGEMPQAAAPEQRSPDFFIIERKSAEAASDTIAELVTSRIPRRFALDPTSEIQVLCPMHRGPAGTILLNQRLQSALNPAGAGVKRGMQTLRCGDRVMQLRNNYEKEVFNGDTGSIVSVAEEGLQVVVSFDGRELTFADAELDQLSLAYAVSIHKSQGSEYPAVVLPFLTSHFVMLSRNLLYTAVTRARKLCVLVADPKAISIALSEIRKDERCSGLATRLRARILD